MSKILIDEATVKLALEALEGWKEYMPAVWDKTDEQAIKALREALTSVPDWVSEAKEQPAPATELREQEPVATLWQHGRTGRTRITMPGDITDCDADWFKAADLYTSPPAQRTWVGLTDEEIDLLINGRGDEDDEDYVEPTGDGFGLTDSDLVQLVRRSEAKLKEKNT